MRVPVSVAAIFICPRLKGDGEDERAKGTNRVEEDGAKFSFQGRRKKKKTDTEAGVSCSSYRG